MNICLYRSKSSYPLQKPGAVHVRVKAYAEWALTLALNEHFQSRFLPGTRTSIPSKSV